MHRRPSFLPPRRPASLLPKVLHDSQELVDAMRTGVPQANRLEAAVGQRTAKLRVSGEGAQEISE